MTLDSRQLAESAGELAAQKKAEDIVVMDMREVSNFADYFVICTASSDTQMRAVADSIVEGLEKLDHRVWHSEGYEVRRWILLDYVHVVIHVFLPETREYYGLERLWGDAPSQSLSESTDRQTGP